MCAKYNKNTEKNFLLGISIIFIVLTVFLIKDIFAVIVYSIILAYFLYPLHKRYFNKIKNERISAILAIFTSIFLLFIPLMLLSYFLILNLIKLVVEYKEYIENPEVLNIVISNFISKVTNSSYFSNFDFSELINMIVGFILDFTKSFFSAIPEVVAYFFIMLFITYYILVHNKKILSTANEYIPLSMHKQNNILRNIEKNLRVLFRGYFLTAIIQTFVAFIGYWVLVPKIF